MSQGYVIVAHNNQETDYVACARTLAKSIKLTGDKRPICLITDHKNYSGLEIFDHVVDCYQRDEKEDWHLSDDYKVYENSPFDETFKIESDVIITRKLDNWWLQTKNHDIVVATGTKNYFQQQSNVRFYRKNLDDNKLPDVYNGLTYFKKNDFAKTYFELVKEIFDNWKDINSSLEHPSELEMADTDTVYAIACQIMGVENTTIKNSSIQWVHMKQKINGFFTEDWTKECVWELLPDVFRINSRAQLSPVHYVVKTLAKDLEKYYDRYL